MLGLFVQAPAALHSHIKQQAAEASCACCCAGQGSVQATEALDAWSLGILALELFSGRSVWRNTIPKHQARISSHFISFLLRCCCTAACCCCADHHFMKGAMCRVSGTLACLLSASIATGAASLHCCCMHHSCSARHAASLQHRFQSLSLSISFFPSCSSASDTFHM
jgi:hypothetical protein